MSNFYARHVAPRIIHTLCGLGAVAAERAHVVPQAEGTVLEIGIGSGHNLPHYDAKKVKKIIGIDPSGLFLKIGAKRFDAFPVPVEIIQARAEDMPVESGCADTAVVTYTLCSVDTALRALGEVRRVLKPAGRVLLLEHGRADSASLARWQDRLNPLWRPLAAGCNLNRDMRALLDQSGFAVERMDTFYMPGLPKLVGFHYRGTARPR